MSHTLFDLTGYSCGTGKHLTKGLAQAGATVIINGINQQTVSSTVSECEQLGLSADGQAFEVIDAQAVNNAVAGVMLTSLSEVPFFLQHLNRISSMAIFCTSMAVCLPSFKLSS